MDILQRINAYEAFMVLATLLVAVQLLVGATHHPGFGLSWLIFYIATAAWVKRG